MLFSDFGHIDFGDLNITGTGGTGWDQFLVDNGRYDVDLGMTINGNVVIEGGAAELQVHNVKL